MLRVKKKELHLWFLSASLQDATKCEFHFALSEVLEGGAVSPEGPCDEMKSTSNKTEKRGGMIPVSWVLDATVLQT